VAKIIITGDKALDKKLASLGAKLANKIVRSSMRKSAKNVKEWASQNLTNSPSIVTGKLRAGMKVRAGKRSRSHMSVKVETTAGTHKDPGYGGAQVEFGARHMPPEPFLRPAVYDHESEIRAEVIADVNATINEAARK
jgi:HK97 gp10 family phage protein